MILWRKMKLFSCCLAILVLPLGILQALPLEPLQDDAETGSPIRAKPDPNPEVHFLLFTKKNPYVAQILDITNQTAMAETNFDFNKPTKVLVHGWTSNPNQSFTIGIRDAYLNTSDVNIITVDWSPVASWDYLEATRVVPLIADFVVEMLIMVMQFGLKSENIHIIGHSMGAQVAGVAGLRSPVLLPRVTGLDPAGPLFDLPGHKLRISPNSAQFVDIIHSCAGLQGMPFSCGHVDFYPNGGIPVQPGCGFDLDGGCSHARSHLYLKESITRPGAFMGIACSGYIEFLENDCPSPDEFVEMGENTPRNATGAYFLRTNDISPYGRGIVNKK